MKGYFSTSAAHGALRESLGDALPNVSLGGCCQPGELHRLDGDWKGVRSIALGAPRGKRAGPFPRGGQLSAAACTGQVAGARESRRRLRRPSPASPSSAHALQPQLRLSAVLGSAEPGIQLLFPEELRTPARPQREKRGSSGRPLPAARGRGRAARAGRARSRRGARSSRRDYLSFRARPSWAPARGSRRCGPHASVLRDEWQGISPGLPRARAHSHSGVRAPRSP